MPLSAFPDVPGRECEWFQLYVSTRNFPLCSFQVILSSALGNLFTCMCWLVVSWRLERNPLQISAVLPPCSSLLSVQLSLPWYFALWILAILFTWILSSTLQLRQKNIKLHLNLFSLSCGLEALFRGKLGQLQNSLHLFPISQGWLLCTAYCWTLENLFFFIYFVCF